MSVLKPAVEQLAKIRLELLKSLDLYPPKAEDFHVYEAVRSAHETVLMIDRLLDKLDR